jgi:hypothetical protein
LNALAIEVVHHKRLSDFQRQAFYCPSQAIVSALRSAWSCCLISNYFAATLFSTHKVDTQIPGNLCDPWAKLRAVSQLLYFNKTFEHSLLCGIFSIFNVSDYAQADYENVLVVSSNKQLIRTFISVPGGRHQVFIRTVVQ